MFILNVLKNLNLSQSTNRVVSTLPETIDQFHLYQQFQKFFKKLSYNQLCNCIEYNNILIPAQFAIRPKRLITSALKKLIESLYQSFEGLEKAGLAMLRNYQTGRVNMYCREEIIPSERMTRYETPQGSALGPFQFLIYINDMSAATGVNNRHLLLADGRSASHIRFY